LLEICQAGLRGLKIVKLIEEELGQENSQRFIKCRLAGAILAQGDI
jgi:hypothetical protein